ncbi:MULTISPECIES: hypothetical protein [unclassified Streptomyces]|uniref:hypothetical protein n=1 Tax=unclassified Streptomyces TaxID=2593676 RepID=UPI001BE5CBD7|nr:MULTISPECIES: hypothetical protein [unclassified Streptomyces]MBT2405222.1 hypothetical protein [Streptomyces sp. ISL-21]MBT2453368.1 hypothetical protein [Streptomyces sp. ISL-86]MBT2610990.1 hypothetical protein [Streptomyces sp. ISL-87]
MSTNRSRRIDHDTAEQLLGGHAVGAADGLEALAGLLSAAAAPAADGELSGERAALAAFRAARLEPVRSRVPARAPSPRHLPRRPMLTSGLTRLLSAKVAAAAVATALGGVAVAAGTGHLPASLGGGPAEPVQARTSAPATPGSVPPGITARSAAPVPADLAELCRVYSQVGGAHPEDVLAERRFTGLVAAAGGPGNVAGYCAPALDASGGPSPAPATPTDQPARTGPGRHPTPRTQQPGNRPASPGATHSPAGPGSHPTAPPDNRPSTPAKGGEPSIRPKP